MLLKNRLNGEFKTFGSGYQSPEDRTLWLFRKRIKDFDRLQGSLALSCSFLTITQSDLSLDTGYHWVTDVLHNARRVCNRRGVLLFYVAALEIQPKRYVKYGVLAPHWHIAIAHSLADAFPHADRVEVNGRLRVRKVRDGSVITWDWLKENVKQKFGLYFCCDCWSRNVEDYLGKYLAKSELLKEFKEKLGRRVRVFASSRFPVEHQMTWFQKKDYGDLMIEHPDLEDLYWHREGASIVGRGKEVVSYVGWDGEQREKVRFPRVRVIRGEWVLPSSDDSPITE